MYFITTKRMLEVCFSAHPNIQYRTEKGILPGRVPFLFLINFRLFRTCSVISSYRCTNILNLL